MTQIEKDVALLAKEVKTLTDKELRTQTDIKTEYIIPKLGPNATLVDVINSVNSMIYSINKLNKNEY